MTVLAPGNRIQCSNWKSSRSCIYRRNHIKLYKIDRKQFHTMNIVWVNQCLSMRSRYMYFEILNNIIVWNGWFEIKKTGALKMLTQTQKQTKKTLSLSIFHSRLTDCYINLETYVNKVSEPWPMCVRVYDKINALTRLSLVFFFQTCWNNFLFKILSRSVLSVVNHRIHSTISWSTQ